MIGLLFQGCSAQSKYRLIDAEQETVLKDTYSYYLYYPEDYEDIALDEGSEEDVRNGDEKDTLNKTDTSDNKDEIIKSEKKFPLLLFLHGGGESGDSLVKVRRNGPPKLIARGKKFPFLILAPQNPHKKMWWDTRAVKQLLDTIVANNNVDPSRIYLTGLSRGGGAAWEMAVQYPETFAAMAVVCGMTPYPYASWIDKKMPIWVFHGIEDESIPISESDTMVKKLREMGYDVRFTRYKGVGHDSWIQAYDTETLYDWFVAQKRRDVE
ncbi:MAG TPA: alpha/beta hydrolase [Pricia antarctica]|uniref:Alpha/beta hydrolase n=2 Tax=root TaxID=1 RepID=A0A831VP55_9FLAO|nr:alpha/beta hydrolase [Pricia antarctica]